MWEPRRFTTLLASTACYRDSFTFTLPILWSEAQSTFFPTHGSGNLTSCALSCWKVIRDVTNNYINIQEKLYRGWSNEPAATGSSCEVTERTQAKPANDEPRYRCTSPPPSLRNYYKSCMSLRTVKCLLLWDQITSQQGSIIYNERKLRTIVCLSASKFRGLTLIITELLDVTQQKL
jgi:hypothetical protein